MKTQALPVLPIKHKLLMQGNKSTTDNYSAGHNSSNRK
jgi:hypothetical protein